MIYAGQQQSGVECVADIRARYDGAKRSPFDEAECGHHYARAMASWAAVLAMTGFNYSGVTKTMTFAPREGQFFWSNGYAYGSCSLKRTAKGMNVDLAVLQGQLDLSRFLLRGLGEMKFGETLLIRAGERVKFVVTP